MNPRTVFWYRSRHALLLAASVGMSAPALAGDPSAFIQGIANAPPEAQLEILRIVLKDVFGSPDEVRANFSAACNKRQLPPSAPAKASTEKPAEVPFTAALQARAAVASKEATLMALCAAPVRAKIEASLEQESKLAKRRAAAVASGADK